MTEAAALLRRARLAAGMTQRVLAGRAGVTQPEVSAYENGRRQPSLPTLQRLVSASGHVLRLELDAIGEDAAALQYRPMSLRLLANQLADENGDARRWRLVREFCEEFRHAPPKSQAALITQEPAPVDPRWDALLAALAEHLAFHHDLPCPQWVASPERFLRQAWFLTTLPAGRAAALETSPASFRRRGVFLDRSDLEAA